MIVDGFVALGNMYEIRIKRYVLIGHREVRPARTKEEKPNRNQEAKIAELATKPQGETYLTLGYDVSHLFGRMEFRFSLIIHRVRMRMRMRSMKGRRRGRLFEEKGI
jgi:hypothetical protein